MHKNYCKKKKRISILKLKCITNIRLCFKKKNKLLKPPILSDSNKMIIINISKHELREMQQENKFYKYII